MGRQSGGPPEGGTDRSEISVQRGGPQSFAAPAREVWRRRADRKVAGVGCGHRAGARPTSARSRSSRSCWPGGWAGVMTVQPLHDGPAAPWV
jgi:hypothetical protein